MWFETKRKRGIDVHGESLGEQPEERKQPSLTPIPEDPASEIRRQCDHLRDLKSQLCEALARAGEQQIFVNREMDKQWANASIVVRTQESWEVFIKALRELFVEDMRERLDSWVDRRKYPDLTRELHSIRLRRNYVEHRNSVEGREEEERCCLEDISKRLPTSANDWLILQLKALDRLGRALEATIEQIARS